MTSELSELDHNTIVREIGAIAQRAQAAMKIEGPTAGPISSEFVLSAIAKAESYLAALRNAEWSEADRDEHKGELLRRLRWCKDDAPMKARSVFRAVIDRLELKPDPPGLNRPQQRQPKH